MDDLIEKKDKQSSRLMIVLAGGLLFGAWYNFLYPWVRYQFWQSDSFWLIEVGRLILEKHCLPPHDLYSYTATAPHWIVYQWLTEVIFAIANAADGLNGVAIVGEVLIAILYCVLIFRGLLKRGINPIVSVAVIWAAAYAFYPDLSSLRPQLFSFVLFWLLAALCADCKSGLPIWKALSWNFIIAIIWANCHISFLVGLLVLVANFTGSLFLYRCNLTGKRLPILFAAMFATFIIATLVTPYGLSLWSFIGNSHNLYYSQEVLPLDWFAQPRLTALAVASLLACLFLGKMLDAGDFLAVLALLFVGNGCGRLIDYFCIFCCPIIGTALTQLLGSLLNQNILSRLNEALRSVVQSRFYVSGILVLSAFIVLSQPLFLRRNVPVQAAKYLASHPIAGNLFCTAHAGSYLIYSSHGAIPVFMDTRLDLYTNEFVQRFARALNGGVGWKELFAQYKIAAALLQNGLTLQSILDKQPDWMPIYRDRDFSLYIRKSASLKAAPH